MDWKGIWKKVGVIFCLLAAASFLLSAVGSSESIVKELISRRIDVMDGYFSGQSTYKEACRSMEELESGQLLEEDKESFKNYFGTDIEKILDYTISEVEINYEDEYVICAFVAVDWTLQGADDLYRASGKQKKSVGYSVICEKEDNCFKLVQFY